MNGGLKSISAAALLAAAASLGGVSAQAADLGGNCCADLEERVAELEATTVRKGNRNVSVKITGTVAVRTFWHNADAEGGQFNGGGGTVQSADSVRSNKIIMDQDDGSTAFQISGDAQVNSDLSIGFRIDFDVFDTTDESVEVDDLYLTVSSKTFGTVDAGRVDQAMDSINSISLADINDVQLDNSNFVAFLGDGYIEAGDIDGTDDEGGSIRYTSPTLAGFIFSASYGHTSTREVVNTPTRDGSDIWSVALRYAGEFGAFRLAAGIGYENEQLSVRGPGNRRELENLAGSVSVMHTPTGLFANFAAGEFEAGLEGGIPGLFTGLADDNRTNLITELNSWAVVAGVEQKFVSLGKTTLYGFYNDIEETRAENIGVNSVYTREAVNWGVGVTQAIDAAAARWNLQYTRFECTGVSGVDAALDDEACESDADVISTGLAIRF